MIEGRCPGCNAPTRQPGKCWDCAAAICACGECSPRRAIQKFIAAMNGSHSPLAVDVADAHEFTALMRFRAGLWQPGRRTS